MKRRQKPLGVTVWTIFVVIAYGIFPFIGFLPFGGSWLFGPKVLPFNGSVFFFYHQNGEANIVFVIISILLCFITVASIIWTNLGDNDGRICFLISISLNVLWWTTLVIIMLISIGTLNEFLVKSIIELIIPPIWLAVIWRYFTKSEVIEYFKQNEIEHSAS